MFFFRGLDKLFFVILIFNCSTNFAQSKNLDIETSEDIEKLISLKILLNKKITKIITMLSKFTMETMKKLRCLFLTLKKNFLIGNQVCLLKHLIIKSG